jgi:4-hydroxy-tetrahydrodipicolinate reductase
VENLLALAAGSARAVCGTTGWSRDLPRVTEAFARGGGALVHAANFSVGVRHFFDLATRAARLYGPAGYAAYLLEEHHAGKRDAPSGTARTIAAIYEMETGQALPVTSVRAGTIPGTHRLVFESPEDEVEILHRARSRAGFAKGAVWAAERVAGKAGVFEFGDLLKEVQ